MEHGILRYSAIKKYSGTIKWFDMEYEWIDLDELKKCPESYVLAVNDTINVVTGKWKLPVMAALIVGKKRFKELEREIPKITPRMLSKELRELELNGMITRTVDNATPPLVTYEFTDSGRAFKKVLDAMVEWGTEHRRKTFNT